MDYKKLSKQPLKFVLAEFKFSPILQMDKFIPEVQEAFRKSYPIFDSKTERIIRISNNNIETGDVTRWIFVSTDKKQAIELDQERAIYFTSKYERFEGFAKECETLLKIIANVIEPSLIQRIGFRASNLVTLENNEEMKDLVNSHFTYPSEVIDLGTDKQQKTEILITTNVGKLAIRTFYGLHQLPHFHDLLGRLPILLQIENSSTERMILDFDHFWEAEADEPILFETKYIMQKCADLHEIARKAFWFLTSDYARSEKWA
ncbi:TIGR04255 family protein [Legionella bozemanae]|uniref:TIGR04255 family protein n=1 Tax=Legionella bozemanae TaxID=447 RepID=UPI00399D28CC